QDSLAFLECAAQLVALAVESHSAVNHIPEGIVAGVGMEVVFAAVLHDLDHDFHEIAIAYNHRLPDALEFGSLIFEDFRFLRHSATSFIKILLASLSFLTLVLLGMDRQGQAWLLGDR